MSFDLFFFFFFNKIYPSHVKAVFRWQDQAVSLLLITATGKDFMKVSFGPFRWDYSPMLLGYQKELNVAPVKEQTHCWVCCIYKGPVQPNTSLSHNSVSFPHSSSILQCRVKLFFVCEYLGYFPWAFVSSHHRDLSSIPWRVKYKNNSLVNNDNGWTGPLNIRMIFKEATQAGVTTGVQRAHRRAKLRKDTPLMWCELVYCYQLGCQ